MQHFFSNRSLKLSLMFSSNLKYRNGLKTEIMVTVDVESIPIQKLALFSAQICVNVFPVKLPLRNGKHGPCGTNIAR